MHTAQYYQIRKNAINLTIKIKIKMFMQTITKNFNTHISLFKRYKFYKLTSNR